MFDKIVEQTQSAVKPFSDLMALNAKAVEQVVEKQSAFITGVMNDSVNYAKQLSEQKDIAGFYQTQKTYMEGIQEKMVDTTKGVYSIMTDSQEKTGEVLKSATGVKAAAKGK